MKDQAGPLRPGQWQLCRNQTLNEEKEPMMPNNEHVNLMFKILEFFKRETIMTIIVLALVVLLGFVMYFQTAGWLVVASVAGVFLALVILDALLTRLTERRVIRQLDAAKLLTVYKFRNRNISSGNRPCGQ